MANLHIEPSDHQVHFCLTDETPEFDITLTQVDQRGPLIYRVQPTLKNRYAIWPSVGVVQPGSYAIVSIVLLERARLELEQSFGNGDGSSNTDKIVVEWCRAPETVYRRLGVMGDSDQDYDILSTFWNTKGYEFSTPVMTARQPLEVRYSRGSAFPRAGFSVEFDPSIPNTEGMILPTVSLDTSTTQADPSFLCDESFIMSMDDGQDYSSTRESRGNFLPQSKQERHHSNSSATSTSSPPGSPSTTTSKTTFHKFQLQQILRCTGCYQVFSRDPDSFAIPVMSQACGHSICRGCVVRKADEDFAFTQTYADTIGCPICQIPDAFSQELHINHSLCAVIALMD